MVEKRILMSKIWSYGSMVENNPEVKKYSPMVLWSKKNQNRNAPNPCRIPGISLV